MKERWGKLESTLEFIRQAMSEKVQRYEEHIKEGVYFRDLVTKHNEQIIELQRFKTQVWGVTFSVICAVVTLAVGWGTINRQVDVNTKRLEKLEQLEVHHGLPR